MPEKRLKIVSPADRDTVRKPPVRRSSRALLPYSPRMDTDEPANEGVVSVALSDFIRGSCCRVRPGHDRVRHALLPDILSVCLS